MTLHSAIVDRGALHAFGPFSETLCQAHFAWDLVPENRTDFRGSITSRQYGDVSFTSMMVDPVRGHRAAGQIDHDTDNKVVLTLYDRGRQTFSHDRHEVTAGAGELLLWSGARPGSVASDEFMSCVSIIFPRALVDQHISRIDDLCGRKVSPNTGTGKILSSLIRKLHETVDMIDEAERPAVFRSVLDVVGSCFVPEGLMTMRTGYQAALMRRIETHIRDRLKARSLCPRAVAREFGFTERYLHRLFAEGGVTFSEAVRRERLALATRMLTSTAFSCESITSIALQCGFCDGAYFSRVFKQAFGQTPSEFRNESRRRQ